MNDSSPRLLRGWQSLALAIVAAAGAALFLWQRGADPARAWGGLLLGNFYVLAMSASAVAFLAMHDLSRATWHTVLRRVPEAMTAYLPAGAVLMLALGFGIEGLYTWSHEEVLAADPVLQARSGWLNPTAFLLRTAFTVALWFVLARAVVANSRRLDAGGEPRRLRHRVQVTGSFFAVLFVLSFTFASLDWLQSLEPHWTSTLFPWYVLSSVFAGGLAMITALVVCLRRRGFLPGLNEHHLHDLGKYLFAFSCFWGYLWFCQYLLIWYANLPEEITHYVARQQGGWAVLFLLNPAVNLVLPLFAMLGVRGKKSEGALLAMSLLILAGHWLDLYLLVEPPLAAGGPRFGGAEIGIPLACAATFLLLFDRAIRARPLVPERDPALAASLKHHG